MELNSLSDPILLEIFSYLPVKDLCIIGRVCKRWRNITIDNSLWRHVDLLPYKLNLTKTWKVIRKHLSECLKTVRLRGYFDAKGASWNKATVSNAMLDDLHNRCPNITTIHLLQVNIDTLSVEKFPAKLTNLTLNKCSWPVGWLKKANFLQLQYLDLSRTSRIDNTEIDDIIKFVSLETLKLQGCYRVKETGIRKVAENLTGLRTLDLGETECTDLALHHISRHLTHLVSLSLSSCKEVSASGLSSMTEGLQQLQHLDISGCSKLDKTCLKLIYRMPVTKLDHTLDISEELASALDVYFKNKPLSEPPFIDM